LSWPRARPRKLANLPKTRSLSAERSVRSTVITGEARYQVVQDIRGLSPSGLLLAAGLKKYF
jgi:hypothetical protein